MHIGNDKKCQDETQILWLQFDLYQYKFKFHSLHLLRCSPFVWSASKWKISSAHDLLSYPLKPPLMVNWATRSNWMTKSSWTLPTWESRNFNWLINNKLKPKIFQYQARGSGSPTSESIFALYRAWTWPANIGLWSDRFNLAWDGSDRFTLPLGNFLTIFEYK